MQLDSGRFARPSFIPELGEEGLTAQQIAKSLGVPLDSVHKKLKRGTWKSQETKEWRETTYVVVNETNGLEMLTYALNTMAAKAFVARYSGIIGDAYLTFLFKCESYALDAAQKVLNTKAKRASKKGVIQKPIYATDLFGEPAVIGHEEIVLSLVTPIQKSEAMLCHLENVSDGISKRRKKELLKLRGQIQALRAV